ncbi:MAG: FAD-dependent oxidoreductase [Proteobacteria bacterium]|nr:FAD-dependent oxidoreductase [Pseudomonadota bacterium]
MTRYVIVGNGVAANTAAEKIRSTDPAGRVTLFSEEPEPFYYRVRLPDVVAGEVELSRITLHALNWYEKNAIDFRPGETVTEVDTRTGSVLGSGGGRVEYDALLLATGARGFIPPVPGTDKNGVFALRSYADARAIAARAVQVKEAVLIGGGLLGLEAGYGLTRLGLTVRVVEFFDRLLPRQMDPAGAVKLQKFLEGLGFSFYLGARTREITGRDEAEGLALEDGQTVPGGLILFSAGIRPNLDLARGMGLEVDKGVKVDDGLRTSAPGVWAAGDLIEHRGRLYGIWPAALTQGEVAGLNMAGGSAVYSGTVMSNSLKVVGVDLTSAGDIDPEGRLEAAIYEDDTSYRKIVLDRGRIAGFIFFGLTRGVKECQAALEKGLDVNRYSEAMTRKDFDFTQLV